MSICSSNFRWILHHKRVLKWDFPIFSCVNRHRQAVKIVFDSLQCESRYHYAIVCNVSNIFELAGSFRYGFLGWSFFIPEFAVNVYSPISDWVAKYYLWFFGIESGKEPLISNLRKVSCLEKKIPNFQYRPLWRTGGDGTMKQDKSCLTKNIQILISGYIQSALKI